MKPVPQKMARLHNVVFVLLFVTIVGLLAWITHQYSSEFDLTVGKRNSLTTSSIKMVKQLTAPLHITAFVREQSQERQGFIADIIERYRRHKADIELQFVNPDRVPQLVEQQGITVDGELLVKYDARQETLKVLSERTLTELLLRLSSERESIIAFVEGHGERRLLGEGNHDWGRFAQQLERRGFQVQALNLIKAQAIPDNIAMLVIASPRGTYLPGEQVIIEQYIDHGGNLLVATEPHLREQNTWLWDKLDLQILPGVVVDATSELFGISDPTFALAIDYPQHPITQALHSQTLFPQAVGLVGKPASPYPWSAVIQTLPRSWTELGEIADQIAFNENTEERAGPITLAMALERQIIQDSTQVNAQESAQPSPLPQTRKTQRVVAVGDSDFLANTYLGNGQNLDLGLAIMQWLRQQDQQVDIGSVGAPDTQLSIGRTGSITLLVVFLILLPLVLLGSGLSIWFRRRYR